MKCNKLVKLFVLLFAMIICITIIPETGLTTDNIVYAATKTIKVNKGATKTLSTGASAVIKLSGAKNAKWYISSKKESNKSTKVAKISSKESTSVKVTGLKKGTCYLRAKVKSKYYTCKIKVTSSKSTTAKKTYTDYELYLLSHLINGEAGSSWISDAEQRAVGSVVLNRMKDKRYPSTMEGVIYQKGQYACTWDGNFAKKPSARAIKNAKYILTNGSTIPSNVVFQAQFVQGRGIWSKIGNHYFCY